MHDGNASLRVRWIPKRSEECGKRAIPRTEDESERFTWLETPTMFCSQPQSWPLPMKLLPKHRMLMLLVAASAGSGTPCFVVQPKMRGACATGRVDARPYKTRVPANIAWFPAESTEVRMTAFM